LSPDTLLLRQVHGVLFVLLKRDLRVLVGFTISVGGTVLSFPRHAFVSQCLERPTKITCP
jgi:hypothetical protein